MNVQEAIFTRRSVGKVTDTPVDKQTIEKLLDAAVQAPNHFLTEPWAFYVFQGEGRRVLGKTIADIANEGFQIPDLEERKVLLRKQEEKAFRAPVVIAVAVIPDQRPNVFRIEEIAAVSAGIQNMLLTAHELGLGAMWRTGPFAYHPKMKELFQLEEDQEIVGFVYVGHAEEQPAPKKRRSAQEKTIWIDEERSFTRP